MDNKLSVEWIDPCDDSLDKTTLFGDLKHKDCFREIDSDDSDIYMKVLGKSGSRCYVQSLGSTNFILYDAPRNDVKVVGVKVKVTLQEVL